jgi:glycosyltransferase involved in cell wall biosynthesis
VIFQPYQPRESLANALSLADVHLVSLRPELEGLVVPSKFYGITAASRPTIFIGDQDGEVARLISKHSCGYTVSQGDESGLAAIIHALAANAAECQRMGENARRAFEAEFDKPIAIRRWNTLLLDLAKAPIPVPQ